MSKPSHRARLGRIIRLHVIPEPAPRTRSVINRQGEGTVIFRSDQGPNTTLVCGKCAAPLAERMLVNQLQGMVLRCNQCGSYNESPA